MEPVQHIVAEPARHQSSGQSLRQLRRYTISVTVLLILACNSVILLGIWGSGVNLDNVFRTPDIFNAGKDICLRQAWQKVGGFEKPIRICSEWLNLSDPSGETHKFQQDTAVVKGADGQVYFDRGLRADYRFFLFAGFVAALVAIGIALKRFLIARYRTKLGLEPNHTQSIHGVS
jgi:hypothetical protein